MVLLVCKEFYTHSLCAVLVRQVSIIPELQIGAQRMLSRQFIAEVKFKGRIPQIMLYSLSHYAIPAPVQTDLVSELEPGLNLKGPFSLGDRDEKHFWFLPQLGFADVVNHKNTPSPKVVMLLTFLLPCR